MRLSSWLRASRSRLLAVSSKNRPAERPLSARLHVHTLEDRTVPSTFAVHNLADSGAGSLRAAVTAANANPGADSIAFDHGVRGTIALTSGELAITDGLAIDGPAARRLIVSGSDVSRVFRISSGVAVSIEGLTLTHGRAVGQGGAILNAGTLTLSNSVVSDSQVSGLAGATLSAVVDAFGGGIFNSASLTIRDTSFIHNRSLGADGTPGSIGSSALGGAIMSNGPPNAPATVSVIRGTFTDNQANAGAAGVGASRAGIGGAISNGTGSLTVSRSLFVGNRVVGGLDNGVPGGFGAGAGGAIGNVARFGNAILAVSDSTFLDNRAVGGPAGPGGNAQVGRGGAIASYIFAGLPQPVTVTATATVANSTLLGNQAIGGVGITGGIGQGGGIANLNGAVLTISNSLIALNQAIGGAGVSGNGGDGQGGGLFNGGPSPVGTPSVTIESSFVMLNRAVGGASTSGVAGAGIGGGLFLSADGVASADLTAVLANDASTSDDDVFGILV